MTKRKRAADTAPPLIRLDRPRGLIYFDAWGKGRGRERAVWCAEITLADVRFRRRSQDKAELERWLKAVQHFFQSDKELAEVFEREAVAAVLESRRAELMRL